MVEPMKSGDCDAALRKRGHTCCGCCCDVRRAVIVIDSICFIIEFIGLFALPGLQYIYKNPEKFGTVVEVALRDAFPVELSFGVMLIIMIVYLIAYGCGIVGAYKYDIRFVGIAALFHAIDMFFVFCFNTGPIRIFAAILPAFFVYLHYVFIQEVRVGIMSPSNYKNEQICCCV